MFGGALGGPAMLDRFSMGLEITYEGCLRLGTYHYVYFNC